MEGRPKKEHRRACSRVSRASRRVYATGRKQRQCQAKSEPDPDGQWHTSAPTIGQRHATGPDALTPTLAGLHRRN